MHARKLAVASFAFGLLLVIEPDHHRIHPPFEDDIRARLHIEIRLLPLDPVGAGRETHRHLLIVERGDVPHFESTILRIVLAMESPELFAWAIT